MRKNIKIIGICLLILIVLLTFFSKTIYNYNLPAITGVLPKNGTLTKTENTTGISKWEDIQEITSDTAGKVEEILVKEGDKVSKGQVLVNLSFDKTEVEFNLNQLNIDKNKLSIDLENTQIKINKLINALENAKKNKSSDFEFENLKDKITRAQQKLADQKSLYEADAVARKEVTDAENELNDLNKEYENLIQKKTSEIASLKNDIKLKTLDMEMMAIKQKSLQDKLTAFEKSTIHAPVSGTIIKLSIKKGQQLNMNDLIVSIGKGHSFEIECKISSKNNFIKVGDTVEVSNQDYKLKGSVSKITPDDATKKVTIKLDSKEVTEGEAFNIKFKKESKSRYVLVPNSAVYKDKSGYFIYGIKRRDGILGQEFYTEKVKVGVGDSSEENTVITNGITFFEPIVLISDKQFTEGQTVKLKNEGDFFAK